MGAMSSRDEAEKLSVVMELLKEIDNFPDHPQSFYHRLLDVAVRVIDEAELGTVSLVREKRWRYVATIGHTMEKMLDLELNADWELSGGEVKIVNNLETRYQERFPPDVRRSFFEAVRPTRYSLIGSYTLDDEARVVISVDIPMERDRTFRPFSVRVFESFLKLAGSYQRSVYNREHLQRANDQLLRVNEDLQRSYDEISTLNHKLNQILGLTNYFSRDELDIAEFFDQLLATALLVVDEADYGSVSVVRNGAWQFLTAVGHDIDTLRRLELRSQWFDLEEGTRVHADIVGLNEGLMPEEAYRALAQATRPIGVTASINARVAEDFWVVISLDRAAGRVGGFSSSATRVIDAFSAMARGFLKTRLYAELMHAAYLRFANKLAMVAERHHKDTAAHNERVSRVSSVLADALGMAPHRITEIADFASLHDIGKVFIDPSILTKPERLTSDERREIQKHTAYGEQLLDDPWFATARNIARYHHERWDGSGYPDGLGGSAIPMEAQIVGVADVFDALRSRRSYKAEIPADEVLRRMREGDDRMAPGQFSPAILAALEAKLDLIERDVYGGNGPG